jgi:MHS family proline/betaine transporter-like MFS transporter
MRKVPFKSIQFAELSSTQKKIKILSFAFIGHFLELYDYTLYVVMLTIISPKFFPSESANISLLFGMLSFALTLIIYPIGSWFWGWYGDHYGRLPLLKQSIMLMALPSLIISILPTYEQIGVWAPIILIICRILQAISASGEIKGAKIFAMEHLGSHALGRVSGFISCSGSLGVLLAMAMGLLLSTTNLSWRVPFLVGSSLAVVGVLIRRKLAESPEFIKMIQNKPKHKIGLSNIRDMIRNHKTEAMIVVILGALLGILSYTMHAFLNPYLISLGYHHNLAYGMGVIGLLASAVSSFITGIIIDKTNARKIMSLNIKFCIIILPISFGLIISAHQYSEMFLYLAYILLGTILGMNAACCSVVMYQLFEPENRCRGVMFFYSLGAAIFGGFTPLILQLLNTLNPLMPAVILTLSIIYASKLYKKYIMEKTYDVMP